ncbi:MAG: tripartite tricarboxylate transporter TctB family protein [Pseudorhodobacter sp.]
MRNLDLKEVVVGLFLFATGLFLAIHVNNNLKMGTVQALGPGAFPFIMAVGLAIAGMIAVIAAFSRKTGGGERVDWPATLFVTASVLLFAILLLNFGFVIAVAGQLLLSTITDRRFTWRRRIFYIVGLTVLGYLIFIVGLRIRVPILEWPW